MMADKWNSIFFYFVLAENRSIELHSPDGIHSCILRATDPQEALAWFNALHSAMTRSTQKALQDANRALATLIGELQYIGWLSRRGVKEQVSVYSIKRPIKSQHFHLRSNYRQTLQKLLTVQCGVNIFYRCRMADRVRKVQMKLIDGNRFLWQLQIVRLGK